MTGYLLRLRQRKIVRWAIAYVAAAWAVLQVLELVSGEFGWPGVVMRIITVVLAIGLFVALVLAWYHGDRGAQRVGGIELAMLAALMVIAAVAVTWVRHQHRNIGTQVASVPTSAATGKADSAAPAIAGAPKTITTVPPVAAQPIPAKSVAVLPFENLSTDKANAYFADGMQDLILTKLADIGDLKVISRTSTMKYASHPDDLKTVGQQLGVAAILEGSVQKAGNQVLINVQLINAKTDGHIWAESYTRTLTNIFGVEGEVADKVATALNAKLTTVESAAIAKVPTRNKEAYQAYLKAIYYLDDSNRTDDASELAKSITLTKQAVAADPNFADAWGLLALSYQKIGNHTQDAEKAVLRALALAPDNPDAHSEYALALMNRREFKAAIAQAQQAVRMKPSDGSLFDALGFVYLAAGDLDKAGAAFALAVHVNPRIGFSREWVAAVAMMRRNYATARDGFQNVVANDPADVVAATSLADVYLLGWGDSAAARKVLEDVPTPVASSGALADAWYWLDLYGGDHPAALKLIQQAPTSWFQQQSQPLALYQAQVYRAQGDDKRAKQAFAQARASLEAGIKKAPGVAALHASLSLALAGLGDGNDALGEAQRAVKLTDVFSGNHYLLNLAKVEAWTGQTGAALKSLDGLLAKPAGDVISVNVLKLDPTWNPIRHDPRFQALLEKYAERQPVPPSSTGSAAMP